MFGLFLACTSKREGNVRSGPARSPKASAPVGSRLRFPRAPGCLSPPCPCLRFGGRRLGSFAGLWGRLLGRAAVSSNAQYTGHNVRRQRAQRPFRTRNPLYTGKMPVYRCIRAQMLPFGPGTGPVTPKELQKSLDFLNLTPTRLSRIIGADERTARRWVQGESPIPRLLELVLVAWVQSPALLVTAEREARHRQHAAASAAAEVAAGMKPAKREPQ